MKIYQLPDGARFIYEGEEYVKSGPMFATGKHGRRLIPKYAILQPLDQAVAADAAVREGRLNRAAVVTAFERFWSDCKDLVPEDRQPQLVVARTRFLDSLG